MSASEQRLYFLLQKVAHRLKKRADSQLLASGKLTTAQAAAMSIIVKDGPITQRYLAQTLSQNESAITAMVNRLLKLNYVKKTRMKTDARARQLTATKSGSDALAEMHGQFEQINKILERATKDSDLTSLASVLKDILSELDKDQQEDN